MIHFNCPEKGSLRDSHGVSRTENTGSNDARAACADTRFRDSSAQTPQPRSPAAGISHAGGSRSARANGAGARQVRPPRCDDDLDRVPAAGGGGEPALGSDRSFAGTRARAAREERDTVRSSARGSARARTRARAAKMPNTNLPAAVVVSIAAPWPVSTRNPMPRALRSCTTLTRWRRLRPRRSSFHTTSVSPGRRALRTRRVRDGRPACRSRCRCGGCARRRPRR